MELTMKKKWSGNSETLTSFLPEANPEPEPSPISKPETHIQVESTHGPHTTAPVPRVEGIHEMATQIMKYIDDRSSVSHEVTLRRIYDHCKNKRDGIT